MNGIPADVFNHHIMPAACENQTLRAELTRVRNQLDSKTLLVDYLRCELMRTMCESSGNVEHYDIYGNGEIEDEHNKPTRGIDDFRVNVVGRDTLKEYRVLKLCESPVPTEVQTLKILNWWIEPCYRLTDTVSIQILTTEEREAELIPMYNGERDENGHDAFSRPDCIYYMNFMIEQDHRRT